MIQPADQLRHPDQACSPDARTNIQDGKSAESLASQYAAVAQFTLLPSVPESVAIQFETAKNLYLYAWNVYRFYPVAEMQALATLEFGLRERFPAGIPPKPGKNRRQPTLSALFRHAVDQGLVRNEGFQRWHAAGRRRAVHRLHIERLQTMVEQGLERIEFDDTDAVVTPEDLAWDLVEVLCETLHQQRNVHAHGGSHLWRTVLGTFELVSEILNQIYAPTALKADRQPDIGLTGTSCSTHTAA